MSAPDIEARSRALPWIGVGVGVIVAAFGGAGVWGATVPLAGAVIAKGQVTVDTNRKQVQHLEGGIVGQLRVRNGDLVQAGDILIRLDDTRARASLMITQAAYREALAKEARYISERDEKDAIAWPEDLRSSAGDPAVKTLLASQQAIFESRRETRNGEVKILNERIRQLHDEIEGLAAQKSAAEKQVVIINEELEGLMELFKRGETTRPRILALQREAARLEGERGDFAAKIARARTAIGEAELEIIQKQKAFRNEVVSALRDIQASVNDLRERLVAAQDLLQRIDIRAPVSGKVVGLTVHGENAVIKPGETIMDLVPSEDQLMIEVRVDPQDVDNVAVGQHSEVRVLSFKQRTTPSLRGMVSYLSADALADPQSKAAFYLARIEVPESELARLREKKLQPGMPAEVMIETGTRTALAYMIQPILDSMNRAWRED